MKLNRVLVHKVEMMRFWNLKGFLNKTMAPILVGGVIALSAVPAIAAEFRMNGFTICENQNFNSIGKYTNKITSRQKPKFSDKENLYAKTFYKEYWQTREENSGLRDILNSFTPRSETVKDNVESLNKMLGILVTMEDSLAKAKAVNYFVNVAFAYDSDKVARLGNIPAALRVAMPVQTIAEGKGACGDTSLLKIALLKEAEVSDCAIFIVHMRGSPPHVMHTVPAIAIPEQKKLYFIDNFHPLSDDSSPDAKQWAGSVIDADASIGPHGIYDDVFAACDRDGLIVYKNVNRNNQQGKRAEVNRENCKILLQSSISDDSFSHHDKQALNEISALADTIYEQRELDRVILLVEKSKKAKEEQLVRKAERAKKAEQARQNKKAKLSERAKQVQSVKTRKPYAVSPVQKSRRKSEQGKQYAKRPSPKKPGKFVGYKP